MLWLRQVRKSLPRRRAEAGGPARRPDPHRHHAVEVQRVRGVRGLLLQHGIDGMKLRQLTTLGPVSVHKCTKTLCNECGKPIAPDSAEGVCSVCRIKARTQEAGRGRCHAKAAGGAEAKRPPRRPPRQRKKPPRPLPKLSWPRKNCCRAAGYLTAGQRAAPAVAATPLAPLRNSRRKAASTPKKD